jgi:hypothetical protein
MRTYDVEAMDAKDDRGRPTVNQTQALVLGFFAVVVATVVATRLATPETFARGLRLPAGNDRVQLAIGIAQFVVGLAMMAGYRRAGVWGAF